MTQNRVRTRDISAIHHEKMTASRVLATISYDPLEKYNFIQCNVSKINVVLPC